MQRARADAIRIRFPGSEKTVLDPHEGTPVPAIKGVVRKMARKRKAEEIRRIRRMLAAAKPGSMTEANLRAYMAILMRKAGGTGKRYVRDEKALPSWRDVPDYAERRASRSSRGSLWTIDYDVVLPDGRWREEIVIVRAMTGAEAVAKLRVYIARQRRTSARLTGSRITRVNVQVGHRVPGAPQTAVLW